MQHITNLKRSDIPRIRTQILIEQEYRCPLCGNKITENDRITLDHQHKYRKTDINGENGNGMVRGVLCADCNACEGKIYNAMTRFLKQPVKEERIEWINNLISYYMKEPYPYIHPSEVEKEPCLSKRQFNALNKQYRFKYPKRKPLEFPKSGKMTKGLYALYEEFGIEPYK